MHLKIHDVFCIIFTFEAMECETPVSDQPRRITNYL